MFVVSVRFHEAHLYEHQGKYKIAQEAYEKLLREELSLSLRADILRQLGWMLQNIEQLGDKKGIHFLLIKIN